MMMESSFAANPDMRVKLIFNPNAGVNSESPGQMMAITEAIQELGYVPEAFVIQPGCDLPGGIRDALNRKIRLFAVCGGDGTVSATAKALMDQDAVLCIIPTGTQNNIACSLGIPADIPSAVSLLRTGRSEKPDMGIVTCGGKSMPFLEVCSVGLFSAVYPSCEAIHQGDLLQFGDFLAALVSSPPAKIRLKPGRGQEIRQSGHVILISNMPYVIRRFQVGEADAFRDGLLDVLLFAGRSKLNLVGYAFAGLKADGREDPGIRHFKACEMDIDTDPAMPVMADGEAVGQGHVHIEIKRNALNVLVEDRERRQAEQKGGPDGI